MSGMIWVFKSLFSSTSNWEVSGARAEIINVVKYLVFL